MLSPTDPTNSRAEKEMRSDGGGNDVICLQYENVNVQIDQSPGALLEGLRERAFALQKTLNERVGQPRAFERMH